MGSIIRMFWPICGQTIDFAVQQGDGPVEPRFARCYRLRLHRGVHHGFIGLGPDAFGEVEWGYVRGARRPPPA